MRPTSWASSTRTGANMKRLPKFERTLEIARKVEDPESEGRSLNNLGLVYADLGRYALAVQCYEKSLEIKTKLGDSRGEGATLNNLGNVYNIWGQPAKALECYEKSLKTARELGQKGRGGRSEQHRSCS